MRRQTRRPRRSTRTLWLSELGSSGWVCTRAAWVPAAETQQGMSAGALKEQPTATACRNSNRRCIRHAAGETASCCCEFGVECESCCCRVDLQDCRLWERLLFVLTGIASCCREPVGRLSFAGCITLCMDALNACISSARRWKRSKPQPEQEGNVFEELVRAVGSGDCQHERSDCLC